MGDDELLRRYLLGGVPESERGPLEDRLIKEPLLFELAEVIEDEILDGYAHGQLDPGERLRVERHLLSLKEGRTRLAVIQGLGKIAGEERTARILPFPLRDLSQLQRRMTALAAMLLIGVGTVWLARQTVPPPDQTVIVERPVAPPAPLALPPAEPQEQIAKVDTPPVPPATMPPPTPVVITLAAAVLRSGETIEPQIVPADQPVELRIELAERDAVYGSYDVLLVDTADGTETLQSNLEPREIGGEAFLVVPFEAGQLHPGTYAVEVNGMTAEGEPVLLVARELGVKAP